MERKTSKALRKEALALARAQPGWKSRKTRRNEARAERIAERESQAPSLVCRERYQPPRACHEQTLTPEAWERRAALREREAALRLKHEADRHEAEKEVALADATHRLAELTNRINGILRSQANPTAVAAEQRALCCQLDLDAFYSDANELPCIDALITGTPSFLCTPRPQTGM
jgi:signal transduction histidine kinase